jgi:hypothetical protein
MGAGPGGVAGAAFGKNGVMAGGGATAITGGAETTGAGGGTEAGTPGLATKRTVSCLAETTPGWGPACTT